MITATVRGKQVTVPDEDFQPVHQWNTGKQSEWRDRVTYKMP